MYVVGISKLSTKPCIRNYMQLHTVRYCTNYNGPSCQLKDVWKLMLR